MSLLGSSNQRMLQISNKYWSGEFRAGQRDAIKFARLVELNHFALTLFVLSEIYCTALVGKIKK